MGANFSMVLRVHSVLKCLINAIQYIMAMDHLRKAWPTLACKFPETVWWLDLQSLAFTELIHSQALFTFTGRCWMTTIMDLYPSRKWRSEMQGVFLGFRPNPPAMSVLISAPLQLNRRLQWCRCIVPCEYVGQMQVGPLWASDMRIACKLTLILVSVFFVFYEVLYCNTMIRWTSDEYTLLSACLSHVCSFSCQFAWIFY